MFLFRSAWHKLGSYAQRVIKPLSNNVAPLRSVVYRLPSGSGQNVAYVVLCGGSLTAALLYAYKTIVSDSERFADRIAEINARTKDEWQAKPWPAAKAALVVAESAAEASGQEEGIVGVTEELEGAELIAHVTPMAELASSAEGEKMQAEEAAVVETTTQESSGEVQKMEPARAEISVWPSDLTSGVKILSSSTVEIAAASNGEERIQSSVNELEEEQETLAVMKGDHEDLNGVVVNQEDLGEEAEATAVGHPKEREVENPTDESFSIILETEALDMPDVRLVQEMLYEEVQPHFVDGAIVSDNTRAKLDVVEKVEMTDEETDCHSPGELSISEYEYSGEETIASPHGVESPEAPEATSDAKAAVTAEEEAEAMDEASITSTGIDEEVNKLISI